ncbi:MAG TPA: VWA domain-containing protein, partial [Myxococcaceae bacterium]|nr:VWA domain-containing protein [Myxococcaceae bacterium]
EVSAALAAEVTDREQEIASKQDKDVAVFAARARAAVNVQKAADALARGDFAGANRTLRQNAAIFGAAAAVASPEAVAEDTMAQKKLEASFSAAPSAAPEQVQHEVKAAKSKALRDFGRMGSTY